MSKLFSYISKIILNPIVLGILFIVAVLGGGLGSALGLGFISAPFAYISIPSETLYVFEGSKDNFIIDFLNSAVTNTLLMSLLTIVILLVVSIKATSNMKIIPSGLQNLIEFAIEAMYNTCKKIAGEEKGKIFFPLVMTIFLFVVISNWIGVLPGTGTIGRIETAEEYCHHQEKKDNLGHDVKFNIYKKNGNLSSTLFGFGSSKYKINSSDSSLFKHSDSKNNHSEHHGNEICSHDWLHHEFEDAKNLKAKELGVDNFDNNYQAGILVPFFRGSNSDINTTLALALCAMITIHWWGIRYLGFFGHFGTFSTKIGGFVIF